MTTDAPAKAIPRMVGRYHLLEEVGRATFGPLHLARFEGPNAFQRWSSVMEVETRFSRDPEFREAFFQSARTSARIQHPNVVATLDVGETEGMLWLAVEYLLAETAKDVLTAAQKQSLPVPWDIACRIVADAALGLDAIHELAHPTSGAPMGLVHGRLAPHRVVVTYDGVTKLLEPSAPFVSMPASEEPGQPNVMVGRALAYSAPEMIRGTSFDRRADIFSLGVILWELSAGRRLFGGRDEGETRAKILGGAVPPLSEAVRGFPSDVEALIRQTLSLDPEARPPTAKALARVLHQSLVKGGLVVTEDEVARYLAQTFPERVAKKRNRLLHAADVTHVFNRDALPIARPLARNITPLRDGSPPMREVPPLHEPVSAAPVQASVELYDDSGIDDTIVSPTTVNLATELAAAPPPSTRGAVREPWEALANGRQSAAPAAQTGPAGAIPPLFFRRSQHPPAPGFKAPAQGVSIPQEPRALPDTAPTIHVRGPSWKVPILLVLLGAVVVAAGVAVFSMLRHDTPPDVAADKPSAASVAIPPSGPPAASSAPAPPPVAASSAPSAASTSAASAPASSAHAAPPPSHPPAPAAPPKGHLTIICDPACDEVLDGRASLGPSPIFKRPVAPGPHHLILKVNDPKAEKAVDVTVGTDGVTVVKQSMSP